ncbi:hypothetical protein FisN_12Lu386 [Fistulifera solaris]|uniref:Uncharacterized protein n=1 Tax=Fistulifera solaris TaxID=1519565 RepID=A0A1Z5JM59_FISSO|nr:hypothetical protein FisN_12Lu386 [Fistulifera solaris]|eukprot:GAX15100.1 hypothetical protein FisN_12Lu386 [Fistulifera solaris]
MKPTNKLHFLSNLEHYLSMDHSHWSETIPAKEFDKDKRILMKQLRATQWSSKMQFRRKIRSPRDVSDLVRDTGNHILIWMDEEHCITSKKLPKSVPYSSKFRKSTANIDFGERSVFIYGVSEKIVAESIHFLLCLKQEGETDVRIGTSYIHGTDPVVPTIFLTPQFLCDYKKANPRRRLILGRGCYFTDEQAIVLASHPEPLDIGVECVFENEGRAFIQTLSQRTTDFGTLSLLNESRGYPTFRYFLQVMNEIPNIVLHTNSLVFKNSVHLPMSSIARHVQYDVWSHTAFNEMEHFTIVPRAFTLRFLIWVPSRFHTLFLHASDRLQDLRIFYNSTYPPSLEQLEELLNALDKNQNLYRLELGCLAVLQSCWDNLLNVIGSHKSLRSLVFWIESESDLLQVQNLVSLSRKKCQLDISFKSHSPKESLLDDAHAIIEPVCLQNRGNALTRHPDRSEMSKEDSFEYDW